MPVSALSGSASLLVDRSHPLGQAVIGLVRCGVSPWEISASRRVDVYQSPVKSYPWGRGSTWSQTAGISATQRREWPVWEPTTQPFSLVAYWMMEAAGASSGNVYGNFSGATGWSITAQFGANRRYVAGDTTAVLATGTAWPLNTPLVTIMSYDGSTLTAYLNGVSEGSAGGGGACSYGTFARPTFGANADSGGTDSGSGVVWYFGILNRVVTLTEAIALTNDPWMLLAQPRQWRINGAPAAAATSTLMAQACL